VNIEDIHLTTLSPEETKSLGQKIGAAIESGIVIALTGDLGAGKTLFVQGLASGLDIPSEHYVTSPSYTLINDYSGRLRLFHIDLYRINSESDFEDIGIDEILSGHEVAAVEWAERLKESMPAEYLSIHFKIIDDQKRKIRINAYGQNAVNLLKKLA
jgi:tRNA threonylcarbamoyladenosine biosynthesis protein TsaE